MMKMQIKGLLPALFVFAGLSQAETVTYWNGSDTTISGLSADNGTWTIGVSLNVDVFKDIVELTTTEQRDYAADRRGTGLTTTAGNVLFGYSGSGTADASLGGNRGSHDSSTYVTMGWGASWFGDDFSELFFDNGVDKGLQLGVAATPEAGVNLGNPVDAPIGANSDVYRVDTKLQHGNGWTVKEGEGLSTATPMDAIANLQDIAEVRLDIVHSFGNSEENITLKGDYGNTKTFTTFYLSVTTASGETLRYMGQFDDVSTIQANAGDFLAGSGPFDVDNVTSITNINTGLIDSMYFSDAALNESDRNLRAEGVIPEPATATMSLLALAALAARRRRK